MSEPHDASSGRPGGTYTLVVALPVSTTLTVGALGERSLAAGTYAYTGSALGSGGFSRVRRHRRVARGEHDVRHWHIDYLLGETPARIDHVVSAPGVDIECAVARRVGDEQVEQFGASDCACSSHLAVAPTHAALCERIYWAYDTAAETVAVTPGDAASAQSP